MVSQIFKIGNYPKHGIIHLMFCANKKTKIMNYLLSFDIHQHIDTLIFRFICWVYSFLSLISVRSGISYLTAKFFWAISVTTTGLVVKIGFHCFSKPWKPHFSSFQMLYYLWTLFWYVKYVPPLFFHEVGSKGFRCTVNMGTH